MSSECLRPPYSQTTAAIPVYPCKSSLKSYQPEHVCTEGVYVRERDGAADDAAARVQRGAGQRHAHQHVAVARAADAEPPRAVEVAALPAADTRDDWVQNISYYSVRQIDS